MRYIRCVRDADVYDEHPWIRVGRSDFKKLEPLQMTLSHRQSMHRPRCKRVVAERTAFILPISKVRRYRRILVFRLTTSTCRAESLLMGMAGSGRVRCSTHGNPACFGRQVALGFGRDDAVLESRGSASSGLIPGRASARRGIKRDQ